jgi:hypothetical protein
MAAKGWAPGQHPIRKPTDTKQVVGKIINPPRTLEMGGVGEARIFNTEKKRPGASKVMAKGPVSDRGKGGR